MTSKAGVESNFLKLLDREAALVDVNRNLVKKNLRSCVSSAGKQDQRVLACFVCGTGMLQDSVMCGRPCEPPVIVIGTCALTLVMSSVSIASND